MCPLAETICRYKVAGFTHKITYLLVHGYSVTREVIYSNVLLRRVRVTVITVEKNKC
jgi:hypothetical protein